MTGRRGAEQYGERRAHTGTYFRPPQVCLDIPEHKVTDGVNLRGNSLRPASDVGLGGTGLTFLDCAVLKGTANADCFKEMD